MEVGYKMPNGHFRILRLERLENVEYWVWHETTGVGTKIVSVTKDK